MFQLGLLETLTDGEIQLLLKKRKTCSVFLDPSKETFKLRAPMLAQLVKLLAAYLIRSKRLLLESVHLRPKRLL